MCGIFGIINPKPRKLDRQTFNVLGVDNDSRGGDSCGIFVDKKYEYGVGENRLFCNFFPKSKILNSVTHSQIALGHCRKASVGAINEANAQPVIIKDKNGDVKFVLIHNGTIVNYIELAKKYIPHMNVTNMTDSQVMAHIMYYSGYKVLGEYIGAGAFVIVDYREGEPEVYFFKGESKLNEYSTTAQVERPLFCTYSTTEFIFSSTLSYLKALRPDREVKTVPSNKLLNLRNGVLYVEQTYDRKALWQQKSASTYYSWQNGQYTGTYGYWSNNTDKAPSHLKKYYNDFLDVDENGVYFVGNTKAHGLYWADSAGNIVKKKTSSTIQVALWEGTLLKNPPCYYFLLNFCKSMGVDSKALLDNCPYLVHYLSPFPYKENNSWVIADTPDSCVLYTGTAIFPFTTEDLCFTEGVLDSYTDKVSYKDALVDLATAADYKVEKDDLLAALFF